jgi:hypothetical protein
MSDPTPLGQVSPAPEKAGVWEDFVDIFYAPSAVYERRRSASFWLPMIVVTAIVGGAFLVSRGAMQPILDAEFARQAAELRARNPQMTEEMMNRGRDMQGVFASIFIFLGTPIAIIASGITLWLAGKLVDAKETLSAALLVAAYAFVPRILQSIASAAQASFLDPTTLDGFFRLSIGPARFLDPDTDSAFLLAVLSRFDLFILWSTVLLAIGLAVVARIPRARAFVAAIIVWIAGGLPQLWGAL